MIKFTEYTEKHPENKRSKLFKKVIQRKLQNCKIKTLGIVSCQNPDPIMGVEYSEEDNRNAEIDMENRLNDEGYNFVKVRGIYKGEGEVSFIISDISKEAIEELSNINYQKSYIWGKVEKNDKGNNFLNLYMRDRSNKEDPYHTTMVNNPALNDRFEGKGHPSEFHRPSEDDYYTSMPAGINWVGSFISISELADKNIGLELPKELRESFKKIYEECVCAGNGPGSISSFTPEHVRGVFLGGPSGYGMETTGGRKTKVDTTDTKRDSTPRGKKAKYASDIKLKDGESYLDKMNLFESIYKACLK